MNDDRYYMGGCGDEECFVFGDSNTYGYKPDKSGRYDYDVRWTGRIANLLGNEYNIIEEDCAEEQLYFQML